MCWVVENLNNIVLIYNSKASTWMDPKTFSGRYFKEINSNLFVGHYYYNNLPYKFLRLILIGRLLIFTGKRIFFRIFWIYKFVDWPARCHCTSDLIFRFFCAYTVKIFALPIILNTSKIAKTEHRNEKFVILEIEDFYNIYPKK